MLGLHLQSLVFLFGLFYGIVLLLRMMFFGHLLFAGELVLADVPIPELLQALFLGAKFDLRLVLILILPYFLLGGIPGLRYYRQEVVGRVFWKIWYGIVFFGIFFFYLVDFVHFRYLKGRMNATLFEFLETPLISLEMVWQSYPVLWTLFVNIFLTVVAMFLLNIVMRWPSVRATIDSKTKRVKATLSYIGIFLLIAGGIYGKFGYYPLRWSEAFFTSDRMLVQLAINPVLYTFNTRKFVSTENVRDNALAYYDIVADYLQLPPEARAQKNYARQEYPEKKIKGTPNVIIIVLESLAAFKTGIFNNPLNATPVLDALTSKGLFFEHCYVPVQATARSIFALITGTPDVASVSTSSRNPFAVDQNTILNQLDNYEKYYFLGGSASWGNIRGIFTNNIDGINIIEEDQHRSPRVDVWGISDYDLFGEAHEKLLNEKRPFVAILQSSGFHRPYTIPENAALQGFRAPAKQLLSRSDGQQRLKDYGFISAEELDSLAYQDFALGHFMSLAQQSGMLEKSLVIILGDHGLPVNGAKNVPAGEQVHHLENFHVPLLMLHPELSPRKIESFVSEIDIMPMVMGLLGMPYLNTTLGRDMLDLRFANLQMAFLYYWYIRPPEFGLLMEDFYLLGHLDQKSQLFQYNSPEPFKDQSTHNPELFKKMGDLATGLYHTSRYLLENNKRQK